MMPSKEIVRTFWASIWDAHSSRQIEKVGQAGVWMIICEDFGKRADVEKQRKRPLTPIDFHDSFKRSVL